MDICPFCVKEVKPEDTNRVVINNSGTVCHNSCLEEAKKNTSKGMDWSQERQD